MKKSILITIIVIAVIGLICTWLIGRYNSMIVLQENVENAWGQVENQYQRRADLIPNLVETVKGYAKHENATFVQTMEARAKATQVTVDPTNITEESLAAFQAAQGELTQAISRLMLVSERYPDLKASPNFLKLQDQLEGTENRCTYARNLFNDTANTYNAFIRQFPNNIVASLFGFERKPYFKAEEGAEKAPEANFEY